MAVVIALPAPLMANANRDQIEQVLINLLDNAIKYTPRGGRVEIRAEATGDLLTVYVADTGIGIMSQDLPRVFRAVLPGGQGAFAAVGRHGAGPLHCQAHRGDARRQRNRSERIRARHDVYLHLAAQRGLIPVILERKFIPQLSKRETGRINSRLQKHKVSLRTLKCVLHTEFVLCIESAQADFAPLWQRFQPPAPQTFDSFRIHSVESLHNGNLRQV